MRGVGRRGRQDIMHDGDHIHHATEPGAPASVTQSGPILVFGMPRSGTTWIGKLFDSHPDTLYRHEPDSWMRLDMPRYPEAGDAARYAPMLRDFVAMLPEIRASRVAAKRPIFRKSGQSRLDYGLLSAGCTLASAGSRIVRDFPVLFHARGHGDANRLVWKSIESLGRTGVILDAIPQVRVVHLLRHPCGYIASVVRGENTGQFSSRGRTSDDYGIFTAMKNTALGRKYHLESIAFESLKAIQRLAWHWLLLNEKTLDECAGCNRVLRVYYEDVCLDPRGQVSRMFAFAGLRMNRQTEAFIALSSSTADQKYYSVFREPRKAAARWQRDLSDADVTSILEIVGRSPFAERYGSDPLHPPEAEA